MHIIQPVQATARLSRLLPHAYQTDVQSERLRRRRSARIITVDLTPQRLITGGNFLYQNSKPMRAWRAMRRYVSMKPSSAKHKKTSFHPGSNKRLSLMQSNILKVLGWGWLRPRASSSIPQSTVRPSSLTIQTRAPSRKSETSLQLARLSEIDCGWLHKLRAYNPITFYHLFLSPILVHH